MTQITLSIDDTTVLARLAELSGRLSPDGMQAAYSEIGADLGQPAGIAVNADDCLRLPCGDKRAVAAAELEDGLGHGWCP